jgi:hypothetical protein
MSDGYNNSNNNNLDEEKINVDVSKKSNSPRTNINGSSNRLLESGGALSSVKKSDASERLSNLSGRTSSGRISERVGKSAMSLSGIFPADERTSSKRGEYTAPNDNSPADSPTKESLLIDKKSYNVQAEGFGAENTSDQQSSSSSSGVAHAAEQVTDSLKKIREMLISPRSPRGYEPVSTTPDNAFINIRESQLHPPPLSQLNTSTATTEPVSPSKAQRARALQSITSPRLGLPKIQLYDFGYTKSIESFTKESRFAPWTREELILVLIHNNIHIRKADEISNDDLIEYCDNFFVGKKMPRKRGPYTALQWSRLSRGISLLFIYLKANLT